LEHLEKLKPNLLLDIHLHEHLETLYKDIRHKAIIQYTLPFISVDLNTMADAFKTSVSMLEKELAALITENKINVLEYLSSYIISR
jgi:COP9 signalosome complex subunit 1